MIATRKALQIGIGQLGRKGIGIEAYVLDAVAHGTDPIPQRKGIRPARPLKEISSSDATEGGAVFDDPRLGRPRKVGSYDDVAPSCRVPAEKTERIMQTPGGQKPTIACPPLFRFSVAHLARDTSRLFFCRHA